MNRKSAFSRSVVIGAVTTVLVVAMGLYALGVFSSVPADGSSCPEASPDEIEAWVKSKETALAEDAPVDDVVNEVVNICSSALASNTPQAFSFELLEAAQEMVRANGGGEEATELTADELEGEIAEQAEFQTGEPIEPEDVSCEIGISSTNAEGSPANCVVSRSDGMELPLIVTVQGDGKLLIDVPASFSG